MRGRSGDTKEGLGSLITGHQNSSTSPIGVTPTEGSWDWTVLCKGTRGAPGAGTPGAAEDGGTGDIPGYACRLSWETIWSPKPNQALATSQETEPPLGN
jgi:hypothetical protein